MTEDPIRLEAMRRERKKRDRIANVTFLFAGLGFGSAAYVARTRPLAGRMGAWLGIVGVGVALFAVAVWLHTRARRIEAEIRRLEQGDDDEAP